MARTTSERVAAHRERKRRAGETRLQVEVSLDPETRVELEALFAARAEYQSRAETLRQVIRHGVFMESLEDEEQTTMYRALDVLRAQRR